MQSPVKVWRNQKNVAGLIGKTGFILSWTIVRVPPGGFTDQAPYPVALIELSDGKKITCQLVDYDENDLVFGQKVVTVVRRVTHPDGDGVIPYGIKAKPLV
ncbi:OB-fold domain-containing protein [Candidatus Gottesmanbacteria bacterium]|nr:OB-fold domain-containing protein [Candidatus Gottesmanbacteria bacterium]